MSEPEGRPAEPDGDAPMTVNDLEDTLAALDLIERVMPRLKAALRSLLRSAGGEQVGALGETGKRGEPL